MTRLLLTLLIATVVAGTIALTGCASLTPAQSDAVDAGVRISAAAYITRGQTQTAQAKRAVQLQELTAAVRGHVTAEGAVIVDAASVSQAAVKYLQGRKDMTDGDRALALMVVNEVILQAERQLGAGVSIGADNAARLLDLLAEVDRVAALFALSPTG